MDYIQEELLRQQRALEGLMTGGVRQTERAAERAETERLPAVRGAEELLHGRETAVQHVAGGKRHGLRAGASGAGGNGSVQSGGAVREVRFMGRSQTVQTDVQAISRTIQRDARRYDGGFSLY